MAEVLLTILVTETFEIRSDLGHPSSAEVNQAIAAKANTMQRFTLQQKRPEASPHTP
jgi:hypothetical protein